MPKPLAGKRAFVTDSSALLGEGIALPAGVRGRGWGRIINLSSVSVDLPMTVIPDYQAAKAGIRTLTRSLAGTLAYTVITVNSIRPGLTHSTGSERWLRGIAAAQGWSDDRAEIRAIVERDMIKNFTGKMGEPADIAHAVAFLADPRAGQVNAIDIVIDGGHQSGFRKSGVLFSVRMRSSFLYESIFE